MIKRVAVTSGLTLTMALGIVAGSFSGGVGAFWLLSKLKKEAFSTAGISF